MSKLPLYRKSMLALTAFTPSQIGRRISFNLFFIYICTYKYRYITICFVHYIKPLGSLPEPFTVNDCVEITLNIKVQIVCNRHLKDIYYYQGINVIRQERYISPWNMIRNDTPRNVYFYRVISFNFIYCISLNLFATWEKHHPTTIVISEKGWIALKMANSFTCLFVV